ncbi:hypothetical protein ACYKSR_04400, partial [Escherichia coli]
MSWFITVTVDNENCFHLEMIDVESILSLDSPLGLPPPVSIPVAGGFFRLLCCYGIHTNSKTFNQHRVSCR